MKGVGGGGGGGDDGGIVVGGDVDVGCWVMRIFWELG